MRLINNDSAGAVLCKAAWIGLALLLPVTLITPAVEAHSVVAPAPSATPRDGDRAALASIVMRSVRDVKVCNLAVVRSQTPVVRSFCHDVSADDARTALDGMRLAAKLGATDVRLEPAPGTNNLLDSLAQYSGHDFDRAVLLAQIESAEDDQDAIRFSTEVTADQALKDYENAVLPHVTHLLHLAERTLDTITTDQP